MIRIKHPQDFGAGLLFVTIGVAGIYFAQDLNYGTAVRMGSGYFPNWLSVLIIIVGLVLLIRALTLVGDGIAPPQLRPLLAILASIIFFGSTVAIVGIPLALMGTVLIAAQARPKASLLEAVILGICLVVFVVVVFHVLLGQPMPLWLEI